MSTVDDVVVPLLLADRSPALRLRVLTELAGVPPDAAEARELADLVPGGTEAAAALAAAGTEPRSLSWALCRLGYLGLDARRPEIRAVAERLFALQQPDGSWPLPADYYDMVPLQTAIPLRGIAAAGLAEDPRAERGYQWLLARQLDDGSWPTGTAAGQRGYVAGYRRLPRAAGCRANTTGAVACLAGHPVLRAATATRAGLDLLLGRETRDEWTLGYEVARLLGIEPVRGFFTFYARFDLALLLGLAGRCGAAVADPRVGDLVTFLVSRRGPYGLWDHPVHPQLSRWLTLDLLSSLSQLAGGDWTGTDLRVPFRAYPRRRRRY